MGAQGTRPDLARDLVLDAGALIAYERGDRRARAIVKEGARRGEVIVPSGVLAQVWRGGPRAAPLGRLIAVSEIDALDERRAKEIGLRLGARGASDVTDAHVVCCALEHRASVASSDSSDIEALTEADEALAVIPV